MDQAQILLYTALALLAIWGLKKASESTPDDDSRAREKKLPADEPISIGVPKTSLIMEPTGFFNFDVVGESHYQHALKKIAGPESRGGKQHVCDAMVVHQPDNRHDGNACAVVIEGLLVGYLPRSEAKTLVSVIKSKEEPSGFAVQCKACVTGGWIADSGNSGKYGVLLDIDTADFPALPLEKEMLRFFGRKGQKGLTRGSARAIREDLAMECPERFSEWITFEEIAEHLHSEEGRDEFFEIRKPSMKAMRDAFSHFRGAGHSLSYIKDNLDEFVEYMIDQDPKLEK